MKFLSSFRKSKPSESPPPVVSDSSFENFLGWNFGTETSIDPPVGAPVTTLLHSRLSPQTLARIEERLAEHPELREAVRQAEGDHRLREILRFGTHLPGVDFHQSPQKPPLHYADESFDFVFAISIWSHFGREAGAAWRREMHRILKPGGIFLWTTHGPGALRHYCESGAVQMSDGERFFRELHRDGFSFYNPFGESGDWGIVSEEWGQAFLHPSHVLREATEGWKVLAYRSRHIENNQDLWLFEKR